MGHTYVSLKTGAARGQHAEFREDIALLRAIAIISVLGYHFWPPIFPMGYLGVDIFFVISGYLIMMILGKSTGSPPKVLVDFYYRRLKRIFPLYYFVVFSIGVLILFVYAAVWTRKYFSNYLSTVLLYFNLHMAAGEEDYFADTTEDIPFLHLWTLSVEIQFYIVAPIIFYMSKMKIYEFRVGHLILPIVAYGSMFFAYSSPSVQAFYHPSSRLWQFVTGMIASLYSRKMASWTHHYKKGQNLVDFLSGAVLFFILIILFIPFHQATPPPNLQQFIITIACGIFMLLGIQSTIKWSMFRLGWLAALSYALYLVHYPILTFSRYLAKYHEVDVDISFPTLVTAFLVSMLLRHFYEKVYLQETRTRVLQEVLKYFILSLLLQWKWTALVHPDLVMKQAVTENAKYMRSLYILKDGEYVKDAWKDTSVGSVLGHYRYKNGTGTHRVVITGNSWATQQAHIVREILPENYVSTMDLFAWSDHAVPLDYIAKKSEAFWSHIKANRPQTVFILLRWVKRVGHQAPFLGRKNDTQLQRWLPVMRNLSAYVDHIFIEGHQPVCPEDNHRQLTAFIDLIERGADLKQVNRPFDEAIWRNYSMNDRLKVVLEECPKCHLIKIDEPFIDYKQKKVLMYDKETEISYLDNLCHLTRPGLEMIKKPFREQIEMVLNLTSFNRNK